jgi:hypothetical protein
VRRRLVRALVPVGHFAWPVPLVAMAGTRLSGLPVGSGRLVALAWTGLLAVSLAVWLWHLRGICVRCARRIPDLPSREAERYAWALDWVHRPWRHRLTWAVIAGDVVLTHVAGGRWAAWSAVTVTAATAAVMWALDRHARLQPWCPRCPGGGLGDDVSCPAPIGAGGGHR